MPPNHKYYALLLACDEGYSAALCEHREQVHRKVILGFIVTLWLFRSTLRKGPAEVKYLVSTRRVYWACLLSGGDVHTEQTFGRHIENGGSRWSIDFQKKRIWCVHILKVQIQTWYWNNSLIIEHITQIWFDPLCKINAGRHFSKPLSKPLDSK